MKNIKTKIIFILLALFFMPTFVNAFTKLQSSTQGPVVGEEFYIAVNLDYGATIEVKEMHFKVTYDPSAIELIGQPTWTQGRSSNGTYILDYGSVTVDKTGASANWKTGYVIQLRFKMLRKGETVLRVTREGDAYYSDGNIIPHENSSSITLYGKEPNSNTDLRSLTVEGYRLSPVFSVSKRDYYLEVESTVKNINIVVQKGDSTQTVYGDGVRNVQYGLNKLEVKVVAQNGDVDVFTIHCTRKDDRTGNTELTEITVSNSDLVYEKGVTEYETTVSRSVESVLLTARTKDENATLVGTGMKHLEIGENVFVLTVSSSNGTKTEYTIKINRSAEEFQQVAKSSKLLSLKVNGIVFDLNNQNDSFLYSTSSDVNELNIVTITESKTAKVKIEGNEGLKVGVNCIDITVTETDDTESKYSVIVFKNPNAEKVKDFTASDYYSDNLYETTTPTAIPIEAISKINKNNVTLYYDVENMYGGLLYQVALKNNLTQAITPTITKVDSSGDLRYESNIPEGNEIILYLDGVYKDGNDVKITSYDAEGVSRIMTEGIRVEHGYVKFISNGDQYYSFTPSTVIVQNKNIFYYIQQYSAVIIGVFVLAVVVSILSSKKKKVEPESKEPLY